jgi:hypothetical protein
MISLTNYTKIKILILNFIFYFQKNTLFKFIQNNIKKSNSQVFQDLFVLYQMKCKKKGTFIEIGGGNGVDISNTYLLEKNI